MDKQQRQLIDGLRQLFQHSDEVYSGVVHSVDEKSGTIEVMPDENNTEFILPVLLRSTEGGLKGVVQIPKKGSEVIFAAVESSGKFVLVRASELDKVLLDIPELLVTSSKIIINDGNNDGVIVAKKAVQEWQALQKDINELKTALKPVLNLPTLPEPGNGATSAFHASLKGALTAWMNKSLTLTKQNNIVNEKVKH